VKSPRERFSEARLFRGIGSFPSDPPIQRLKDQRDSRFFPALNAEFRSPISITVKG